jgi:hypothetical protein
MRKPRFKEGQYIIIDPFFKFQGGSYTLELYKFYRVAMHTYKGGRWYVQLEGIGPLHAFDETGFMAVNEKSVPASVKENHPIPLCPF